MNDAELIQDKALSINKTEHTVPATGNDLLTGRAVDGRLTLRPGGCAVIREHPA